MYIYISYTETAFSNPKIKSQAPQIYKASSWAKRLDTLCRLKIWHPEEVNDIRFYNFFFQYELIFVYI